MDVKYTGHLGLRFKSVWRDWTPDKRAAAVSELVAVFEQSKKKVTLRGAYVTQGFRADTDLLLWMYADDFDLIQDLQLEIARSSVGRAAEVSFAFAGIAQEAEFNKAHLPAFIKGIPPKGYLCFYPYSRTTDWYFLPPEERAVMLKEHGMLGREFPDVLTNGVNAFGLGDHEWLLSFETDDLQRLVELTRRQRDAKARKYTRQESLLVVGRRFELSDALAKLM